VFFQSVIICLAKDFFFILALAKHNFFSFFIASPKIRRRRRKKILKTRKAKNNKDWNLPKKRKTSAIICSILSFIIRAAASTVSRRL
jgi:hypothetical protein